MLVEHLVTHLGYHLSLYLWDLAKPLHLGQEMDLAWAGKCTCLQVSELMLLIVLRLLGQLGQVGQVGMTHS